MTHKQSESQPLPTSSATPVDEQSLRESIEGVEHPGHYFEIVYKTQQGLPRSISLKLFPAVRTLFRTPLYTIARCYIGAAVSGDAQYDAINEPYIDGSIIDYERVYPEEVDAL